MTWSLHTFSKKVRAAVIAHMLGSSDGMSTAASDFEGSIAGSAMNRCRVLVLGGDGYDAVVEALNAPA